MFVTLLSAMIVQDAGINTIILYNPIRHVQVVSLPTRHGGRTLFILE